MGITPFSFIGLFPSDRARSPALSRMIERSGQPCDRLDGYGRNGSTIIKVNILHGIIPRYAFAVPRSFGNWGFSQPIALLVPFVDLRL
jgi:hypothetical protein